MKTYAEQRAVADKYNNYISVLRMRDAEPKLLIQKVKTSKATGKEKCYILCPECNRVSNSSDIFCRICGKRLRRTVTNGKT